MTFPMSSSAERPGNDFALAEAATPLAAVLREEVAAAGGRITFARFMELALGDPLHGYYSSGDLAWGRDGDYETSPEVHPIFGYLWARQLLECWERLDRPHPFDIVEVGGGSGAFAVAMLTWLQRRVPECATAARLTVLDGHPSRIDQQRGALETAGLGAQSMLLPDWLATDERATGVMISNELFDALPVHLVERRGEELHEWHVGLDGSGELALELGPLSTSTIAARFEALGVQLGDGARAEVSLEAAPLMRALAGRLERGYIVTIDYGYEAADLYAPWRRMGTLMAYRGQSPQPNPLAQPGLTDLTAHVDFTTLADAAEGCETAPLVSQAEALIALGIGEQLAAARDEAASDLGAFARARSAVDTLLEPAGLGRIRVLVQAKQAPLEGLRCLQPMPEPPRPPTVTS